MTLIRKKWRIYVSEEGLNGSKEVEDIRGKDGSK